VSKWLKQIHFSGKDYNPYQLLLSIRLRIEARKVLRKALRT